MKKFVRAVLFVWLVAAAVNAQVERTMSGIIVKTVFGGRWSGIVIALSNKKYGVQTSYEPSAGDEMRGQKGWQLRTLGSIQEGRQVRVYYTGIDCSVNAYGDDIPCVLKATRIEEIETRMQASPTAEKAWPAFFAALRAAVQKRDRVALSGMMKPDFIFDCCDNMDENQNGETRDEAFRRWDRFPRQGWAALSRLLAQGVVPASAKWTTNNGRSKPNLIAPPSANSKNYRGPIADFEWRNGRWWFVSFQYPEND